MRYRNSADNDSELASSFWRHFLVLAARNVCPNRFCILAGRVYVSMGTLYRTQMTFHNAAELDYRLERNFYL